MSIKSANFPLSPDQLARIKAAYTTRIVPTAKMRQLGAPEEFDPPPRPGDLIVARIVEIGQHKRIELRNGRRATFFVGDEILVCFAGRYAPDQFEAVVPPTFGPCALVAAGGIAATMLTMHAKMNEPTQITPLGYVLDESGERVNLGRWGLPRMQAPVLRPRAIAVVGTSMNAGKTTAAAHLIKGLGRAGHRVGAAKVTGTGAGGDVWHMTDAGAHQVLDFVDAGMASTYHESPDRIERGLIDLTSNLAAGGADVCVIEVADGLLQRETAALVGSAAFRDQLDEVVFAAGDALGAAGGVARLSELDVAVRAVTGCLTASPLASREALECIPVPVMGLDQLCDPDALAAVGLGAGLVAVPGDAALVA